MHKIKLGHAPSHLADNSVQRGETHNYNTRNINNYYISTYKRSQKMHI